MVASPTDATTYDTAKRFLLLQLNFKDNTLTHCLSRWVWLRWLVGVVHVTGGCGSRD